MDEQLKKKIRVSAGDLTNCPRGVYYKKKDTPLPLVHPKIAEIWQLFGRLQEQGQAIQKMVTNEWLKQAVLVSPERFVPWNDYNITGKYDAIVKVDGQFILYEIKGGGKQIFANDNREPFDEHRSQVIIYHYLLKNNFPGIKPRILYVSRSSGERLEIPVDYDEAEFANLAQKAKMLIGAVEKDQPPPPVETISWNKFQNKKDISMAAITCKYHSLCLGDDYWHPKALEQLKKEQN